MSVPTTPRLRPELEIARTGPRHFVLLDPEGEGRFEFNLEEEYLLRLLDGTRDVERIGREFEQRFDKTLSERTLNEFLEHLDRNGLLISSVRGARTPAERGSPASAEPSVPLSSDDPGAKLNGRFDVLALLFGWLLHPLYLVPIGLLSLVAAIEMVREFDRGMEELRRLSAGTPVWLLLPRVLAQIVLFLNLPRELAVGIATRRFGGRVRRLGISWWHGLIPVFRCDPGDSLLMMAPRGRRTVLASASVCHLLIGSLAALGWSMTEPGSGLSTFYLLLIPAWVIWPVIALSPFGRREGYMVLCVLLRQPYLRERALAETGAWLHGRRSPEVLTRRARFWLRAYGLGYHLSIWLLRALVAGGGLWWLTDRARGAGAISGILLLGFWYREPLRRLGMKTPGIRWLLRGGGKWWVRWPVRVGILAAILILGSLPYSREVTGDGRVIAAAEYGVRAQVADEIVQVLVVEGQPVQKGDVIAILSGRILEPELAAREAELREVRAQLDLLLTGAREEEISMARQQVELWRVRLAFAESEFERFRILVRQNAASEEDVRRAEQERDTMKPAYRAAQENLSRVLDGAREEELRAARARVEVAQARLAEARARAEQLTITAPISGRVITPHIEKRLGQVAQVGELIAVIQDTSRLRLEVAADESAGPLVRPGMRVKARLFGLDGGLITGRVTSVSVSTHKDREFRVDPVRTDRELMVEEASDPDEGLHVRVFVDLDRVDARLVPGMTGPVRIVIGRESFWMALLRPVIRYVRTEVWSWLP